VRSIGRNAQQTLVVQVQSRCTTPADRTAGQPHEPKAVFGVFSVYFWTKLSSLGSRLSSSSTYTIAWLQSRAAYSHSALLGNRKTDDDDDSNIFWTWFCSNQAAYGAAMFVSRVRIENPYLC
jgi:hypothetical protein